MRNKKTEGEPNYSKNIRLTSKDDHQRKYINECISIHSLLF